MTYHQVVITPLESTYLYQSYPCHIHLKHLMLVWIDYVIPGHTINPSPCMLLALVIRSYNQIRPLESKLNGGCDYGSAPRVYRTEASNIFLSLSLSLSLYIVHTH